MTLVKRNPWQIKEKDLHGHLDNGNGNSTKPGEQGDMALAIRDYQLNEALALLKGLNILARKSKQPQG